MSDQKPHLDSLFEAATAIASASERAAYLDKACGDDFALRKQVERLLQSDAQAGSFLENPAAEVDATIAQGRTGHERAESLQAGLAAAVGDNQDLHAGNANQILRCLFKGIIMTN